LRFPEFTEPWETAKLGVIAEFSKGTGISKEQRSETGLPCILYGELYTTYTNEVIEDVVSKIDLDPTDLVKSQKNDVIIPSSGETAEDIATARCVTSDNVLLGGDLNIIRLVEPNDGRFMSYQLNGIRKYDIAKIAQGVSVVHLYGGDLKMLSVTFPQSPEQKKIADCISLLDRRISVQIGLIEKLESLISGIIERLTAQYPNVRIADCLECHSSTLQENQLNETGGYRVYGANGICGYTDSPGINGDAILIVKDGSGVGNLSYAIGEYSVIGTSNYLTAKNGYSLRYLYYILKKFNFAPYKTGMAIPHIYFKDYGRAMVYCPSFEEQERIAKNLSKIERKIEIERSIKDCCIAQKQYLLQQMFI
jgi:type I restriction enzyme S subunit